jgi:hypothetical protein
LTIVYQVKTVTSHELEIYIHFLFLVNTESIIFLLKFLQIESSENEESSKNILKMVNTTIESSITLRAKVKRYLYTLQITIDQLKDIRTIVSFISNSIILHIVDKRELLMALLNNAKASYSYEFFKQWFCSFLLFNDELNERNQKLYQDLLKHWSNQFIKYHEILMKILIDNTDQFINGLKINEYRSIFINHMISLCFQQGKS